MIEKRPIPISKNIILIVFILSCAVVFSVLAYARSFVVFSMRSLEYNIQKRLFSVSRQLANMVSAEELNQYRDVADMELPSYQKLRRRLRDFAQDEDILYAFYTRPLGGNVLQYIIDNDVDEKTRVGLDTPPYTEKISAWINQALEGKTAYTGLGNYRPGWEGLLTTYSPVFDQDGKIAALAGVDIPDAAIVRARRMVNILGVVQVFAVLFVLLSGIVCVLGFRQEAARAAAANKAKTAFLAQTSHEIRTPMNAIIGMSELVLRADTLPKTYEHAAGIKQAGMSLMAIINNILDVSQIESGTLELNPAPYSSSSLLSDVINIIRQRAMEKSLEFMVNVECALPGSLLGDKGRIRQILINLLSNAVKYTSKGFVRLTVKERVPETAEVFSRSPGEKSPAPVTEAGQTITLVFEVADSGIGIREDDQSRLFEYFTRLDMRRNFRIEGTGLGLAITRNLCRVMGGDLTLTSEYGAGSVFSAIIPQVCLEPAPSAAEVDKRRDQCVAPEARILVVDDIETNLTVARGLLSIFEVKIDTSLSGAEAVDLVRAGCEYDIIFMDHMMPGMDGIEATAAIRAWEREQKPPEEQVPIIALTANAIIGMRDRFLAQGFNDYLSKPVDIAKLSDIMETWLPAKKKVFRSPEEIWNDGEEKGPGPLDGLELPGVDLAAGKNRYREAGYLEILRIYRVHTPGILEKLRALGETDLAGQNLKDYIITVHGLKGATYGICADGMGQRAEALEHAARDGNAQFVQEHTGPLITALEDLLKRLGDLLERMSAAPDAKIRAPAPDPGLLQKFAEACKHYRTVSMEETLAELEKREYESGGELIVWLREQMDNLEYNVIRERLEI